MLILICTCASESRSKTDSTSWCHLLFLPDIITHKQYIFFILSISGFYLKAACPVVGYWFPSLDDLCHCICVCWNTSTIKLVIKPLQPLSDIFCEQSQLNNNGYFFFFTGYFPYPPSGSILFLRRVMLINFLTKIVKYNLKCHCSYENN